MSKSQITLKDVYDIVERLEDKMDDKFEDHEARLRNAEKFQNKALGLAGVAAIFSGALSSFIWEKITGQK